MDSSALQERLSALQILDAMPDAVVVCDGAGVIRHASAAVAAVFGYPPGELVGIPLDVLVPARFRADHREHVASFVAAPRVRPMGIHARLVGLRKDGSEVPVDINLAPLAGAAQGWTIACVRDITERRAIEERARQLERVEQEIRQRDEVLAIASHELRAPVGSLQLQVGMLQRAAADTADQLSAMRDRLGLTAADLQGMRARMEKLERQARRLGRLIDELLDTSRVRFGELSLKTEDANLTDLVREAVAGLRDEVERSGSPVDVEAPEAVHGHWDPVRIEQVLANLLLNAAKFGEGRPILVTVGGNDTHAFVSVLDHGVGIRPEDHQRIFGQFERAVGAGGALGLGLGLYIANQIVQAHGGVIRIESALGAGSRFTVELPRALHAHPAAAPVDGELH